MGPDLRRRGLAERKGRMTRNPLLFPDAPTPSTSNSAVNQRLHATSPVQCRQTDGRMREQELGLKSQPVPPHCTSTPVCFATFLHQKITLGKSTHAYAHVVTHTHTHHLLAAHSFVEDLHKHEEFPHFIIYNKLVTWVLKGRYLQSSLTPLLPTMVTYLCKRIRNRDFMLISLNLYFLHFNLTSLLGNSFQTPLQIFIGLIVGREITLDTDISIPTTSSTRAPREG